MPTHQYHGLPEDGSDRDSRWFERRTGFEKTETRCQVEFKRTHWPDLPDGVSSNRPSYHYPHILPEGHLEKNFYPPIYHDVLEYIGKEEIELTTQAHNLLSSQVCCLNFLFPLRQDLDKATSILSAALPGLQEVLRIEFEYTGPDSATKWLGEPAGGKRGLNRTSIDAAVWWKDQSGCTRLTFVEWKYTEKNFGACGGYRSDGNRQRDRCRTLKVRAIQPQRDCYVATGRDDRTSRRYWEHLTEAGISLERFGDRSGCPFIGPFYQLMRQYLLAAHCRASIVGVHHVDLIVIGFQGNQSLLRVPRSLSHLGEDVVSAWNSMLTISPPLRLVFIEDMLAHAASDDWRDYMRERYGV